MKFVDFETFCADGQLIGEPISKPWSVFYAAIDGLPLDEEGIEMFRACTGRDRYEPRVYTEATAITGRRSEKTSSGMKYLLWKAMTGKFRSVGASPMRNPILRIPIICQDLRVARDVKSTAESYVRNSTVLSDAVAEILTNEIRLENNIAITVYPASKSSTRGLSCPIALLDELAFVTVAGASDIELVRQVKPSMIRFGQERRLLKLSTPWQKSGVLFSEYSRRDELPDVLVWNASTDYMTPRISLEELQKERAADASYYAREFGAAWVDDIEAFLSATDIDAAVVSGRKELPPLGEGNRYSAAIDASTLTGRDRFVFGISHTDSEKRVVIDVARGWSRAPVPQVCDEIAVICKLYGVKTIFADQYGYAFLAELFRQRGLELKQLAFSARNKPELFLELKTTFAQGKIALLDHPQMLRELRALESKRLSGGGYRIAAPRGEHDDFPCLLALLINQSTKRTVKPWVAHVMVKEIDGRGWTKI